MSGTENYNICPGLDRDHQFIADGFIMQRYTRKRVIFMSFYRRHKRTASNQFNCNASGLSE